MAEVITARTISQIYDALIAEKQANTELNALQPNIDDSQTLLQDLTSTSKVAIWRLTYFVVAVGIWFFENILANHTVAIEAKRLELVTGTDRWYAEQSKLFQLGDTPVWDGNQYNYAVEDTDKQIISFSAAITEGQILIIKVAKDDGSGFPEKLTTSELTSFTTYINDYKLFSGTLSTIISDDPDDLKVEANVTYDPLILNSNGSLISDPTSYPVEDAINAYIAELDFNGVLRVTSLIDAIQSATGVKNSVKCTLVEARKNGASTYNDILATSLQEYNTYAGYLLIDSSFTLRDNLTYIAG